MINEDERQVEHHPFIGVEFSHNLYLGHHINNATAKGHMILKFLRGNLGGCSHDTKAQTYKSLDFLRLEYAEAAWNLHQISHVQKVEKVRRWAAWFVTGNNEQQASVTYIISTLKWKSLQQRCVSRLTVFYKIINFKSSLSDSTI